MNIYIAGGWNEIPLIRTWMQSCIAAGFEITEDWTKDEARGISNDDLTHEQRREIAKRDYQGIKDADVFWFIVPEYRGGRSAFTEFGIALARAAELIERDSLDDFTRPFYVFVSGKEAKASIFTELPWVFRYDTHEETFAALLEMKRMETTESPGDIRATLEDRIKVTCDETNNPPEAVARGELRVDVGIPIPQVNIGFDLPGTKRDPKPITEEMHLEKEWFKDAREVTFSNLRAFMDRIMNSYEHDYGTVCHAIAACALAATWAANRMPGARGGITGFQSGFVMWDFVQQWQSIDGPMRLMKYEDMLYPQYEDQFARTITKHTMKWLVEQAKKKLDEKDPHMHPDVTMHLTNIAEGRPPFGFIVKDEG